MKKYILRIVLLLIFLQLNILNAFASTNNINYEWTGKLEIILRHEQENIKDAEITIYHIADIHKEDEEFYYKYLDEFSNYSDSQEFVETNTDIYNLIQFIKDNNIKGISKSTNQEGLAIFDNLQLGVYLAVQTDSVPNYDNMTPSIFYIPTEENNEFKYSVTAIPKIDILHVYNLKIKKIWNDNIQNRPSNITVEILDNNKNKQQVILSKENNWEYEWDSLLSLDKYNIKEINIPNGYTVTYDKTENTFIITNTNNNTNSSLLNTDNSNNTYSLLKTGKIFWPIVVLFSIGIICIIVGYIQLGEKKNIE